MQRGCTPGFILGGVTQSRHLDWPGSWNARDLCALPAADGRQIRWGALVRSEHLVHVTAEGWRAIVSHGVRTLVDLRTTDQAERDREHPPSAIRTELIPIEEGLEEDANFAAWSSSGLDGTPLYYEPFLRRWPDRCARAVAAVAHAQPGGVLVHCSKGCDRTGLVVMLLLQICGVSPEIVADDYALTGQRLISPPALSLGLEDDEPAIQEVLQREGCASVRHAMLDTMNNHDLPGYLRRGGLTPSDEDAIRNRMLCD